MEPISFESFVNDGGDNSDYNIMKRECLDWPKKDCAYWGDLDKDIWGFGFSKTRDSDLLTESNWDAIIAEMSRHNSRSIVIEEWNHWACGYVTYMMINTNHKRAMYRLYKLMGRLADYPVLDEEDWSRREYEQASEAYDNWAKSDVGRLCQMNDILGLLDDSGDFEPTEEQEEVIKRIVTDCILDYNPGEGTFQDSTLIERLQEAFPDPEGTDPWNRPFVPDTDTLTLDFGDWAA